MEKQLEVADLSDYAVRGYARHYSDRHRTERHLGSHACLLVEKQLEAADPSVNAVWDYAGHNSVWPKIMRIKTITIS